MGDNSCIKLGQEEGEKTLRRRKGRTAIHAILRKNIGFKKGGNM